MIKPERHNCLDCKHCYIDNLFYEVRCKKPNHITMLNSDNAGSYITCKDFEEDLNA